MYTKDEARRQILEVWRTWEGKSESDNPMHKLEFYGWLCQNRSDLLQFRGKGDKWQIVNGWLLNSGKVKD